MKATYSEAIAQVFKDEGGYSNDAADPGGPTKYGITIHDARTYWKKNATAGDVRNMPKSVAEDIYRKHYADPVDYNNLPPGVDYAVLDYGINSGVSRALRIYKKVKTDDAVHTINSIYDERLRFLKSLHTWPTFGKGWERRCISGRKLALALNAKYKGGKNVTTHTAGAAGTIAGTVATAHQYPDYIWYIAGVGILLLGLIGYFSYKKLKGK